MAHFGPYGLFFIWLNGSFGTLFLKNLDFSTPIFKSAIFVPLFYQILKFHSFLFSFDDVELFNIMWYLLI
jgi:hypothetical protein